MKPEDKYLDYLFESAREEEPQISLEEVVEVFSASTSPTLLGLAKGWFLKNIHLNSLLFLSAVTLSIIAVFLFSSSNNFSINESNKNQIVTNQNYKSSFVKDVNLNKDEEFLDFSSSNKSKTEATKNIESSLNSKVKIQTTSSNKFQKSKRILISESPILHSVKPELQLESPIELPLSISEKNTEKEKIFPGYQPKYETVDEVISPWVVGQESDMPWKINRQVKIPILNETERVLHQFMDTKYLEQIFEKEENGYYKPLNMLVYYSIDENYFIQYKGKKIRLLNEKIAPDFDPDEPFIDVKRFKIKKAKAHFNFTYKDYQVQMQLRRVGEGWKRHKIKVKKSKEIKVNMTF